MCITKAQLRKRVKNLFDTRISVDEIHQWSYHIVNTVLSQDFYKRSVLLMSYMPLADEVDMRTLHTQALCDGKRVLLPKCNTSSGTIAACEITSSTHSMQTGYAGIAEPLDHCECLPEEIDLIIVPGRAFDMHGHRIGRGLGYYDRFLAKAHNALKVGVAFESQLFDAVQHHTHDIIMDVIVTEKQMIHIHQSSH